MHKMRVYLDNCCYNRPFDEQTQPVVRLETEAKLFVQSLMRKYVIEYAWSFVLRMEISCNPDLQRKKAIADWAEGAVVDVAPSEEIRMRGHEFEAQGIKPTDALHLACAEFAGCDWFFTVDRGVLKKVRNVRAMRVANPVEFILEGMT